MCSLVMSLCSSDLHVTSLNNNYNTLNSSRLTVVQIAQRLVFAYEEICRHKFASYILLMYMAKIAAGTTMSTYLPLIGLHKS